MTIDGETIGILLAVLGSVAGAVVFLLKTGARVEAVRVQTSADLEAIRQKVETLNQKHDAGFAEIRPRMNGLESRVATTEKDVVEVKALLAGLKESSARIEGALAQLQHGIDDSLRARADAADRASPRKR